MLHYVNDVTGKSRQGFDHSEASVRSRTEATDLNKISRVTQNSFAQSLAGGTSGRSPLRGKMLTFFKIKEKLVRQ